LITVLSVGNVAITNEGELEERLHNDCILREVDGRIWLQHQIVYLGMVGVMATPPFCLSEDLAIKFRPLVSKLTSSDEQLERRYHSFDRVFRKQKGHLILVSMYAGMRAIYDEQVEEIDRARRTVRPEYYEIVEAEMVTAEFVGEDWIEAWRTVDEALQEIVTESQGAPGKEKRKHLAMAVEKGNSALNAMIRAKPSDNFQTLVGKVDPNARIAQAFARAVTYRWQEWLEKFSTRLGIKINNPLPEKAKLWIALEVLADSKSLAEFKSAKERIPQESLDLLYGFDLGQKVRALEIGHTKDYKFETLRASAKELLPAVRESEERSDSPTETTQKETIEEFGLVLRPVEETVLAEKQILLGLEVVNISAEHGIIGVKVGDIIIYYRRVNDVVMSWHNLSWQTRILTNRIRQGNKLPIIRGNRIINLAVSGKQ
jgi:hypothetical protein